MLFIGLLRFLAVLIFLTLRGSEDSLILDVGELTDVCRGQAESDQAVSLHLPLREHPNILPHLHIPGVTKLVSRAINQTSAAQFGLLI